MLFAKRREGRSVLYKTMRGEEIEVLAAHELASQSVPFTQIKTVGQGRRFLCLNGGMGDDVELIVRR